MDGKDILVFFIVLFFFLAIIGFFVLSADLTVYDGALSRIGSFFDAPDLTLGQLFGSDTAPTQTSEREEGPFSGSIIFSIINVIKIISGIVSTILIALILVITMRSWQFNDRYSTKRPTADFAGTGNITRKEKVVRRDWNRLVKKAGSATEGNAGLLIIEADAILDKALKSFGIVGDDMGGRMKAITPTLRTSDLMWQSHKLRNDIAHTPDIVITKRRALGVLADYEKVLGELDVI